MTGIVLLSDPRVAAVQVEECREPLVDLREDGRLVVDRRKVDPEGWYAHLRRSLLERLVSANQQLARQRLQLLVVEGYRPLEVQARYWADYQRQLTELHPAWPPQQIHHAAARYVSPPELAPHSTGGAVDLTLADWEGRELDLGTRVNASPEESAGACYTWAANVPMEARDRRVTLAQALTTVGLVNYPTEWWHWSLFERYHAFMNSAQAALYGPLDVVTGR
ncbi:M15 family metallopeptidase [Streptacidiphilus melanogenes]|uniref:M15 family metallopeptidase n=1 Tax=Streptacidiphilus melanogenes TaxID=411235 RepID=UPI0005A6AD74|nr:M15 family metallopeptidase [Streptacidiphilus melanogenes]